MVRLVPPRAASWVGVTPAALLSAFALATVCLGAEPPVRLWPGPAPGDTGGLGAEADTTGPTDRLVAGRPVVRTGNVADPTITLYRVPADRNTGAAVVVCPGGGYHILAMDLEGTEACDWLNSIGVNAVLLKYRVPKREGRPQYAAPLQDAQRAVGLVRAHARDWGVDPARIGVLGFSAGGDLCATLCAHSGTRTYPRVDEADDASCRPDFQVLIYPAYLTKEGSSDALVPEVEVGASTPPTFLAMAQDDPVHVENVLVYAQALQRAKVPMELHVYPSGGHGYGLRPSQDYVTTWPRRAADWMRSRGIIVRN
jgi:acetyl esterase/lipase